MHATIGRYDRISATQEEIIQAGRQLASTLSKAPGFISYAVLEVGDGVLATVSVFENQADLEQADRLIAASSFAHQWALRSEALSGEVLVQKGM